MKLLACTLCNDFYTNFCLSKSIVATLNKCNVQNSNNSVFLTVDRTAGSNGILSKYKPVDVYTTKSHHLHPATPIRPCICTPGQKLFAKAKKRF